MAAVGVNGLNDVALRGNPPPGMSGFVGEVGRGSRPEGLKKEAF